MDSGKMRQDNADSEELMLNLGRHKQVPLGRAYEGGIRSADDRLMERPYTWRPGAYILSIPCC